MGDAAVVGARPRVRDAWRRSLLVPVLALVVLTLLIVSPAGDFPLNDDWVYAKMVQWLANEGRLHVHPWAAAYSLTQTLWAAPFVKLFGFSFTVLRISTLILAAIAAWAVARCGRELGLARRAALACAAVVFCNPLFMNLSYTFMTDVPFMCCLALSCLFYVRAFRSGHAMPILLGSAFAVAAFFDRQPGVLATLAFVVTVTLFWIRVRQRIGLRAIAAVVLPWSVAAAWVIALRASGQETYTSAVPLHNHWFRLNPGVAGVIGVSAALYMGLFLMPLAAGAVWGRLRGDRPWSRGQCTVVALTGVLLLAGLARDRRPLPRLPNLLHNLGVGPILLHGAYDPRHPWSPYQLSATVLWLITLLSLVSVAVCAGAAWRALATRPRGRAARRLGRRHSASTCRRMQRTFLFLLGLTLIAAPYMAGVAVYFDRYLIPAVPPISLVVAGSLPSLRRLRILRPTAFGCALFYVFSLVCLQDYLAWNRARWQVIGRIRTEMHAPDTQIDGGYEFNGMYTSDAFAENRDGHGLGDQGPNGWWVMGTNYRVAMTPLPDYRVLGQTPYFSWLGFETRNILLLGREVQEVNGLPKGSS